MVELITVIVVVGILGAIGASRFFDNSVYAGRAYADQVKSMVRYAQKLAIAQNRNVFVRSQPAGFAVCFQADCAAAANLALAPGGSNSGSSATKTFCSFNGGYVSTWLCEATPSNVVVTSNANRDEFAADGYFSFDNMGRPHNKNGLDFGTMILSFASGASRYTMTIETETGYVHE